MLVTFRTRSHAKLTLHGEVAEKLLDLMGQGTSLPGVLSPEEIPEARRRLEAGIERAIESAPANCPHDKGANGRAKANPDDSEHEPISLATRAGPLFTLLEAAERGDSHVVWSRGWTLV